MPLNSISVSLTIEPWVGYRRLTASVVGLSQIAHAALPSIVVFSLYAQGLPSWSRVEHGMTVTAPLRVFRYEIMITGRRFQNSGNWASFGKSHRNAGELSASPSGGAELLGVVDRSSTSRAYSVRFAETRLPFEDIIP